MQLGVDLVSIKRFKQSASRGGEAFIRRLFSDSELSGSPSLQRMAGMFAAKEAVMKAVGLPIGAWHDIEIWREDSGRPRVRLSNEKTCDISISHDGDMAVAIASTHENTD